MHRLGLSARLILTVGILATAIISAAALSIGFFVHYQAEQQIKQQLVAASRTIISDFLMNDSGDIKLQQRDDGQTLVSMLRNTDISLYLTDASGAAIATYGIYRNVDDQTAHALFDSVDRSGLMQGETGIYVDRDVPGIGRIDTYTAPLRNTSGIAGYMQVSRINYMLPIITRSLVLSFTILLPVIWIISVAVIRWGTRYTLDPLGKLVDTVESLDVDDLPEKLVFPAASDRDVRVLSIGISSLIVRIRSFLKKQRELAQNLSHEFKTPLARMNARLSSLSRYVSPDHQKIITAIMNETVSLGQQVDSLLDVSLYESPHVDRGAAQWRFVPFIRSIIAHLPDPASVHIEVPGDFAVPIPKGHARTIWRNILENAVKYGSEGGTIWVFARGSGRSWTVEVVNMTSRQHVNPSHVFIRRYRGLFINTIRGHGLGMAIVRDTCRQLGLTVQYVTDDPNRVCVRVSGKHS